MSKFLSMTLLALACVVPSFTLAVAEEKAVEASDENKFAYLIAHQQLAPWIIQQQKLFGFDNEQILLGLQDALAGKESKFDPALLQSLQAGMMSKMEEAKKGESAAFLAETAKKEGVTATASGLLYEVVAAAEGAKPAATSTVKVHYHGTLPDGTVFDSSVDRGEPAEFPLNRVIPGWTEGLQLMSVGAKYRFYIPSDLAYGPRGSGQKIGPHQALIFDVELIEIVK